MRTGVALVACVGVALATTFACTGTDPDLGGSSGGSSSGANGDGSADAAPPRCNPDKPFEAPEPVGGINSVDEEVSATLSADELTVYFTRRPAGNVAGGEDVYVGTRPSINDPFSGVTALAVLNTADTEDNVTTTSTALTLYFHSNRPDSGTDSGAFDLWTAERTSLNSSPLPPTPITSLNTNGFEQDPYVAADGKTLYFVSTRNGVGFRIFRAEKTGAGFSAPVELELDFDLDGGEAQLTQPVVSENGKTLFVGYYPTPLETPVIWSATRENTLGVFSGFAPLAGSAFTPDKNLPTWISPDGCHLYFRSTRAGGAGGEDIWMARRGS